MSTDTDTRPAQADLERAAFARTVWTHDVRRELPDLLNRLRRCDGTNADAAVVVWEHCQLITSEVDRLEQRLAEAVRLLARIIDARPHKGAVHLAIVEAEEWGWQTKLIPRT